MNETRELYVVNDVLSEAINAINLYQLYQPYCQDQDLQAILNHQLEFMANEYNHIVDTIDQSTAAQAFQTNYDVSNTTAEQPQSMVYDLTNTEVNNGTASLSLTDYDVTSAMLGCAKTSATSRMNAALQCTTPEVRNALIQSATNCADRSYELSTYMDARQFSEGVTQDEAISAYQPTVYHDPSIQQTTYYQ